MQVLRWCAFAIVLTLSVTTPGLTEDQRTIEGVVQSISGDTLTVKTADDRTSIVDVAAVAREASRIVALGSQVTIAGRFAPEENKFRATSIESAAAGASASPATDRAR